MNDDDTITGGTSTNWYWYEVDCRVQCQIEEISLMMASFGVFNSDIILVVFVGR